MPENNAAKNPNMELYNRVRAVPQEAQKPATNGSFKFTDINPMWRIKTLTQEFGPCGLGWYYEIISERSERIDEETLAAIVDINLYVKYGGEWSKPIPGTGGNILQQKTKTGTRVTDEGYKMALTDAISVACKALGIGADIYYSADASSKYTRYYDDKQGAQKPAQHAQPDTTVQTVDVTPAPATDEQKRQIRQLLSPEDFKAMQNMYGENLASLNAGTATKAIYRAKQKAASA